MATKFAVSLCDSNDRASNIVDNFLNSCTKFDSIDMLGGSRFSNNFYKNYIRSISDIPILKSQFMLSYNMHLMSAYIEEACDLPKNTCYHQNLAEINNVVVLCNGSINNKEYIANMYGCSLGQSLQEFLVNVYHAIMKRNLKDSTIPTMIRDIDSNMISFVIYDKNLNEIYIYNRGDMLFMRNIPGMEVIISSEIIPIGNSYPHYNFHKLPSNCAIKIDTKTMFVQQIPIHCNVFNYGRSILLDNNKILMYSEVCDLEYYTALNIMSSKDVFNAIDINTVYFGFDTDIDRLIIDRMVKLRRKLNISGKLPIHVKYSFDNIYKSESEAIEELNQSEQDGDTKNNIKKVNKKPSPTLRDSAIFMNRKINFIAASLINMAIEYGCGAIVIPNTNKRNNRLLSVIRDLINSQVNTPIYAYSILDQFNTQDLIRYVMICKEVTDLDNLLINCDRNSLSITIDDKGKQSFTYDVTSNYNYDVICAYSKCGIDNPFNDRYIGREKIDPLLVNANLIADKLFDNEMKAHFINNAHTITKNHVELQRKILSF